MPAAARSVKLRQIVAAHFTPSGERGGGMSYSVLGLGEDGGVYRYDPKCEGWIPWPMKMLTAECRLDHKARR